LVAIFTNPMETTNVGTLPFMESQRMDRLIWSQLDFNHKPLTAEHRRASRKSKGKRTPRKASSYRGAKRNARSHIGRCNPSLGDGYQGQVSLNRSQHWKPADNYFDARDLSQSNRPVA
jgi:hypothetical protein